MLRPDLKRDFAQEYSDDKQRFEELQEIHLKAMEAECSGEKNEARNLYKALLKISQYGYFKLLAEAGLYRLSI